MGRFTFVTSSYQKLEAKNCFQKKIKVPKNFVGSNF
jgi:hypothetical protein